MYVYRQSFQKTKLFYVIYLGLLSHHLLHAVLVWHWATTNGWLCIISLSFRCASRRFTFRLTGYIFTLLVSTLIHNVPVHCMTVLIAGWRCYRWRWWTVIRSVWTIIRLSGLTSSLSGDAIHWVWSMGAIREFYGSFISAKLFTVLDIRPKLGQCTLLTSFLWDPDRTCIVRHRC